MPREKTPKNSGFQKPSSEKIEAIRSLLDRLYPEAGCSLDYHNPLHLLVATILSAQCTDERVNKVTPHLFQKYPTALALAEAPLEELEAEIKSTGFYHNKAKNIRACCRILVDQFDGQVVPDLETLVHLPGIGRKTANVVLANAFNIPSVFVDTHVGRVSQRLGLTENSDPVKIEYDLMAVLPRESWIRFCHQLIHHGRQICLARKPRTEICPLKAHCTYAQSLHM